MPEYEREIKSEENINSRANRTRFVSDAERARRIPFEKNTLREIVDNGGIFNALDGTRPHTQEEANEVDKAYLAQQGIKGLEGQQRRESLVSRTMKAIRRAVQHRRS